MRTPKRQQVPWEIAAYSPRVHAQASLALNHELTLAEATADADRNPQSRQDREDLHQALDRMANGFLPYLPGGSRHQQTLGEHVSQAREALRRGDLDATLDHLTTAAKQRELIRGVQPAETAVAQLLDEASGRLRPNPDSPAPAAAVTSGRGPAMSAMTAANRVRDAVDQADQQGHPLTLNEGDVEALERVDPDQADHVATRADWQHRRPERAPAQPDQDVVTRKH